MTQYIIVSKKAAPGCSRDDLKSAKATRPGTTTILPRRRRRVNLPRVNWGAYAGGLLGALVAAAIWVPAAYAQRGYWAIGGEIFLIALAAGFGAWLGGDPRG